MRWDYSKKTDGGKWTKKKKRGENYKGGRKEESKPGKQLC